MRYVRLPRRLAGLFRSRADIGAEVDEEIAFHLDMRTASLVRSGMAQAEARERAEREFGDAQLLKRELRRHEARVERRLRLHVWLDEVRQDVALSVRTLLRAPSFTGVALTTLALGIGASVAMFAVVNAVVLRPLPYPEPDRLVHVWPGNTFNIALVDEVAAGSPSLAAVSGVALMSLTLTGHGEAALLRAQAVDAGYFDVFGVQPRPGRPLRPEERDPARSGVVLLSHELWQARFGGDEGVVGRRLHLDGYGHAAREVVGVMPRGFVSPMAEGGGRIDVWVPLHVGAGRTVATDSTWYVSSVVARLNAGAGVDGAAAEVGAVLRRVSAQTGLLREDAVASAGAARLLDSLVGPLRRSLYLLLGAVGVVLLLACVNLANLMMARSERRRGELMARAALGATRGRLVRALLMEGAVLAAAGAAGGIVVAYMLLALLRVVDSSGLPRMTQLSMDGRVLAFTAAATGACLLLFAVLPALRATAGDLRPAPGAGRAGVGVTRAARRAGAVLIGAEVALAMVLVTAATLLVQSYRVVRGTDSGLQADRVLSVQLAPSPERYAGARAAVFYDELLERLRALPGVRSAGAIHLMPFTWSNWGFPYLAEGQAPPAHGPLPTANFRVVTPDYFETVGVPVIEGRTFSAADGAGPAVGIINRALANRLWPGESAVGRVIRLFGNTPFMVVGVVGDVRQHALDVAAEPELYRPLSQWPLASMVVMLHMDGEPGAWLQPVSAAIRSLDADVPIVEARPLAGVLGESVARRRFFARVLTSFGGLALLLGAVGVYGLMAYSVAARVREYSVRIALGATHADVLREALRSAAVPVAAGLLVGAVVALGAARLIEHMLYGVQPHEPGPFVLALVVLGGVALIAGWLPARRVLRVEPMGALKAG